MDALSASGRAAMCLVREREAVAAAATGRLYAERPELLARHGARGRERCLEDLRFTVEHMIPAVDLEQPALFVAYVRWLDELLRARGVSTSDVVRGLELIEDEARARLADDELAAVTTVLRAGLAVLHAPAGTPA